MKLPVLVIGLIIAGLTVVGSPSVSAQTQTDPKPEEIIVEVKPGDSLAKIAKEHQTTYQRLYDGNPNIQDPDLIHPGNKVRIPKPEEQLANRPLPTPPVVAAAPVVRQRVATTKARRVSRTAPVSAAPASGDVWDRLAQCESGGNWNINTGNGYSGGLQFTPGSWRAAGGSGSPHQASREEQIERGKILQQRQGWGAWPACTRKLGIR